MNWVKIKGSDMKQYHYLTNCVNCGDGNAINAMTEQARQITWKTFLRHVPIQEVRNLFIDYSYRGEYLASDGQPTIGFHLKDDWAVSFWLSKYKGQRCYYICHSGIEYIFTKS